MGFNTKKKGRPIIPVILILLLTFSFFQISTLKILPQEKLFEHSTSSSIWKVSTEEDFEAGTLKHVTALSSNDLVLAKETVSTLDDFENEAKISYTKNVILDTDQNEVRLQLSDTSTNTFNKTYGGSQSDSGTDIQPTTDDGYIISGVTRSYGVGNDDGWLVKIDKYGKELWNKTLSGPSYDYTRSVQQTSDGGYIILGDTWSYGAGGYDIWLVKTDSSGNQKWNRTYGGQQHDHSKKLLLTTSGGYIFAGSLHSMSTEYDFWLVKTDSAGSIQWTKTYGDTADEWLNSFERTNDGGYILIGNKQGDIWIVKTDSSGNKQWDRSFGGYSSDYGISIKQTSDGGYIILGYTESYGAGMEDIWLIKLNSMGNKQWDKTFGGASQDGGQSIIETPDLGYAVVGYTRTYGAGYFDGWLVKVDQSGNEQWNRTIGSDLSESFGIIKPTEDNGYLILGNTDSYGAGMDDIWLLKTDSAFNFECRNTGILISQNLIGAQSLISIDSFYYTASILPETKIVVQFSQDNIDWYNSNGFKNAWDVLKNGYTYIELTYLDWSGPNLYYKLNFSSNTQDIPSLQNIKLTCTQYYTTGTFESQPFDCGGNEVFKTLSWDSEVPVGTEIRFQLRSAKTMNDLTSKSYIGPEGKTTTSYLHSGGSIWDGHNFDNWLQYKACFSTQDNSITPILHFIEILYNKIPEPPTIYGPVNNTIKTENRPKFTWKFYDPDLGSQMGFQWQMDDNCSFDSIDYYFDDDYSSETLFTPSFSIKDGIWYWRIRTKDSDGDWGLFTEPYGLIIDTRIKSPTNVTVHPNTWSATNSFSISWDNPDDLTDIVGVYYKKYSPPESNTDGKYIPGYDINSIKDIQVEGNGEHKIYVWLKDKGGNINCQNFSLALLYFDDTAPTPPLNITLTPSNWSSLNSFTVDWEKPFDFSGIKAGAYYYLGKNPPPSHSAGKWMSGKPINVTTAPEGSSKIYIWLEDNLGNKNYENYAVSGLKLDTKPPVITHTPVTTGEENKDIIITAKVSDINSGVNDVILFFRKPKDSEYREIKMDINNSIYSAKIPKEFATSKGLGYYIEAFDKSSPNNRIYYGLGGNTRLKPTSENVIDIKIEGESETLALITNVLIPIIIIIVIILLLNIVISSVRRKNKDKQKEIQPSIEVDTPQHAPPPPIPMPPQPIPPPARPQPIPPQTTYVSPPSEQISYTIQPTPTNIRCERCDAVFSNRHSCPNCGYEIERF